MCRIWKITIPVRPKAVQSVRGGRGGFFPDRKVVAWKNQIRPYIELACAGGRPTEYPLRINAIRYIFKLPSSARPEIRDFVAAGGVIPYVGTADITDNLAKGLVDTCAGLVFVNDKLIWQTCQTEKIYGIEDGIYIEFEETPDVLTLNGVPWDADKEER